MKAYYLTIIGVILLILSIFVRSEEVFNAGDSYLDTHKTFLLQIAAGLFLLAALIMKIFNFKRNS